MSDPLEHGQQTDLPVRHHAQLVVRKSDGCPMLFVETRCGERVVDLLILEADEDEPVEAA